MERGPRSARSCRRRSRTCGRLWRWPLRAWSCSARPVHHGSRVRAAHGRSPDASGSTPRAGCASALRPRARNLANLAAGTPCRSRLKRDGWPPLAGNGRSQARRSPPRPPSQESYSLRFCNLLRAYRRSTATDRLARDRSSGSQEGAGKPFMEREIAPIRLFLRRADRPLAVEVSES